MPQPAGAAGSAPLAIVTGATSGFGYAACELLLARGVDVILACRSPSSAAAAAAEMAARAPAGAGSARVMSLDLSDLASVAAFAAPRPSRQIGMVWRRTSPLARQLVQIAEVVRRCGGG